MSSQINHEVVVVGNGNKNKVDYWLIKNWWGTGWTDNGLIKIKRDKIKCVNEANCKCFEVNLQK